MKKTIALLAAFLLSAAAASMAPRGQERKADGNRYIGVAKCKNCHEAKAKGSQYTTWKGMKHAKAFEVLGGEEAKKVARAKGVDDPQKSDKCLKCHTTAFTEPADRISKGFDLKNGVQCESCHGPGERHFKARMAAADEEEGGNERISIPDDEIVKRPPLATCLGCHNEESPQFKPFCMKKRFAEIRHLDPRVKRTEEELKAMSCGCGDACACKQGECGGLHGEKK